MPDCGGKEIIKHRTVKGCWCHRFQSVKLYVSQVASLLFIWFEKLIPSILTVLKLPKTQSLCRKDRCRPATTVKTTNFDVSTELYQNVLYLYNTHQLACTRVFHTRTLLKLACLVALLWSSKQNKKVTPVLNAKWRKIFCSIFYMVEVAFQFNFQDLTRTAICFLPPSNTVITSSADFNLEYSWLRNGW